MSNPSSPAPQSRPSGSTYPPYPPAGGQPHPPAAYGQLTPGGVTAEHPEGTLILVMGIIGIVVPVCAPIAWVLGNRTLHEITTTGANYSNDSQIRTGRMLGIVFTILWAVGIVLVILSYVLFIGVIAAFMQYAAG